MPLPQPKKGMAPPTGKVKTGRRDQLLAMAEQLASEQVPESHTMTAIEGAGRPLSTPPSTGAAAEPAPGASAADAVRSSEREAPLTRQSDVSRASQAPIRGAGAVDRPASDTLDLAIREMDVAAIRASPFQPKGRPSTAAVQSVGLAIAAAGSLHALVSPDGMTLFARLDPEAARLAELAFDVAEHGVRTPVEVRVAEDGRYECLAGHRRLAAARLAGFRQVPALDRGTMSSAAAAATVLRGNLHRENFTTWQEAVLVTEVQERRRADGYHDTVRSLGAVMGWSHGKVNMLLRIRRALSPAFLARAAGPEGEWDGAGKGEGGAGAGVIEDRLSRAAYRDLERLANEADDGKRVAALRQLVGLGPTGRRTTRIRPAYRCRPTRTGGFIIEVHRSVESLDAGDVAVVREALETQLQRVRARETALRQA